MRRIYIFFNFTLPIFSGLRKREGINGPQLEVLIPHEYVQVLINESHVAIRVPYDYNIVHESQHVYGRSLQLEQLVGLLVADIGVRRGIRGLPYDQIAESSGGESAITARLEHGLREIAHRLVKRVIVEHGRKVDEALRVTPLVEYRLKGAIGHELESVLQIEADVELGAEAGIQFSTAHGRVTVRGPLPNG